MQFERVNEVNYLLEYQNEQLNLISQKINNLKFQQHDLEIEDYDHESDSDYVPSEPSEISEEFESSNISEQYSDMSETEY